jgi:phosphoribosylglycinamide formyltransferase-1
MKMQPRSGNTTKLAIFASGSGSNAHNIIEYFQGHPQIKVEILLSNNPKAYALERAKNAGIKTRVFDRSEFYGSGIIIQELKDMNISWIILAGFLWLIPENLVKMFPDHIINIHPALLPKYGGKGMFGMHVHRAVVEAAEAETGISIHMVNPVYDEGTILFQAKCSIEKLDKPEDVARKVQELEHKHFPSVIETLVLSEYHS